MNLDDLQRMVAEFSRKHSLDCSIEARALDTVSEIGELCKEILKAGSYGKVKDFRLGDDWKSELGDVVFSLSMLANATDVRLEDALISALRKYEERIAKRGDAGSTDG